MDLSHQITKEGLFQGCWWGFCLLVSAHDCGGTSSDHKFTIHGILKRLQFKELNVLTQCPYDMMRLFDMAGSHVVA